MKKVLKTYRTFNRNACSMLSRNGQKVNLVRYYFVFNVERFFRGVFFMYSYKGSQYRMAACWFSMKRIYIAIMKMASIWHFRYFYILYLIVHNVWIYIHNEDGQS